MKLWLLLLDFLNKNALTPRPYLFSVKSLKSVLNYMLRIGNVVRSQKFCAENHEKSFSYKLPQEQSSQNRPVFSIFLDFLKKKLFLCHLS